MRKYKQNPPKLLRVITLKTLCLCLFNHVWLFALPWTVAHQTPLSMKFSRQEYGSGLPFPSPVTILDLGIKPLEPYSHVLASRFFNISTTWEAPKLLSVCLCSVLSPVQLFVILRTVVPQASLSMGFSRQEYWSRLPFPPSGNRLFGPRGQTSISCVFCIGSQILKPLSNLGSLFILIISSNY